MNNKHNPVILKAFNKQLTEFLDDLLLILPGEKDIIVLSTFMKTVIMGKSDTTQGRSLSLFGASARMHY